MGVAPPTSPIRRVTRARSMFVESSELRKGQLEVSDRPVGSLPPSVVFVLSGHSRSLMRPPSLPSWKRLVCEKVASLKLFEVWLLLG